MGYKNKFFPGIWTSVRSFSRIWKQAVNHVIIVTKCAHRKTRFHPLDTEYQPPIHQGDQLSNTDYTTRDDLDTKSCKSFCVFCVSLN